MLCSWALSAVLHAIVVVVVVVLVVVAVLVVVQMINSSFIPPKSRTNSAKGMNERVGFQVTSKQMNKQTGY